MERGHLLEKIKHISWCMYIETMILSMDVSIQCRVRWYRETWNVSSNVAAMYIPDLSSLSTISWNVAHMDVIMKMILNFGFHHIIEMIWGLIVVSSTSLDAIILKSENVIKYYVKYSGKVKIWNLLTNRLSKTFDVSRKIVLCASPLGLLIMIRFQIIAWSFISVELFFSLKSMFLSWLHKT